MSDRPVDRARRICFVAPFAYPVLAADRNVAFAGGAEVQQSLIARELARRGHHVSMVCMDFGQPDGIVVDGVTVHRMHAPDAGWPVLRFLHPRLSSLWRALSRADAEIYYQRAGGALTGFVAGFARWRRRLSVYAAAHDMDFAPEVPLVRLGRDKALFRWGLRSVSHVIVQTEQQRLACIRATGREPTLIRSCYAHVGQPARFDGPIIWVATIKPHKRPEWFVELARRFPHRRFRLVGGGTKEDMARLEDLARSVTNLELTGFVPYADVETQFDGAALFVNTSVGEGFPNTFLQAWSRGLPTVSFFDAGARWHGESVGALAASLDEMTTWIAQCLSQPESWAAASRRCSDYFRAHHGVAQSVDDYESLFARLDAWRGAVALEG